MRVYKSILPSSFLSSFLSFKRLKEAFRGQKSTGTWVIEATEFKFEVRSDLRGHLEAAMASEATIVAILGNMHIDARVIEVACIKSEVKFEFGGH